MFSTSRIAFTKVGVSFVSRGGGFCLTKQFGIESPCRFSYESLWIDLGLPTDTSEVSAEYASQKSRPKVTLHGFRVGEHGMERVDLTQQAADDSCAENGDENACVCCQKQPSAKDPGVTRSAYRGASCRGGAVEERGIERREPSPSTKRVGNHTHRKADNHHWQESKTDVASET